MHFFTTLPFNTFVVLSNTFVVFVIFGGHLWSRPLQIPENGKMQEKSNKKQIKSEKSQKDQKIRGNSEGCQKIRKTPQWAQKIRKFPIGLPQ
jgi:hypothetical protein